MNVWRHMDGYAALPDSDFIQCDIRDFHILCVDDAKYYEWICKEIHSRYDHTALSGCLFTKGEILKTLKGLEDRSVERNTWGILSIEGKWFRYIRFIRWDDGRYLAYNDKCEIKILFHKLQ